MSQPTEPIKARIVHEGYSIVQCRTGPFLAQDLSWTPYFHYRGIWHELADAEQALARAIKDGHGKVD